MGGEDTKSNCLNLDRNEIELIDSENIDTKTRKTGRQSIRLRPKSDGLKVSDVTSDIRMMSNEHTKLHLDETSAIDKDKNENHDLVDKNDHHTSPVKSVQGSELSFHFPPSGSKVKSIRSEKSSLCQELPPSRPPKTNDPTLSLYDQQASQFIPLDSKSLSQQVLDYSPSISVKSGSKGYQSKSTPVNSRDIHKNKARELVKIERFVRRGYKASRKFTIIDRLSDIIEERERLEIESNLDASLDYQKKGMMLFATVLENANQYYSNPFDLNLNGWTDSLHDNIDSFEPVFEELYEKHKENFQMAPELKLVLMFIGSAVTYHFSQKMIEKAEKSMPGFGAVVDANPDLKKMYTNTASQLFMQNIANQGKSNNSAPEPSSGGLDLMGMLSGMMGGGGNPLAGMTKNSQSVQPKSKEFRSNTVRLTEPPGIDDLLEGLDKSNLTEAPSLRFDDDATSRLTSAIDRSRHVNLANSSKRSVKVT